MQWITPASSSYWWSGVWGANANKFNIRFNCKGLSIKSNGGAATSGNLDVGVGETKSKVKTHVNHAGNTGFMEIEAMWRNQAFLNFATGWADGGYLFVTISNGYYMFCGNNIVYFYKPTTNASDDRLKGNEELIEDACETLSKLRPQLYDKKPGMENDGPTSWYKESGLIAQEMYYDAPGLRHLVHRGKPDLDEEGNSISLPEIPTSINPQQDPDYSSWGKDPASVNYIGLIADLIKAGTELHEMVKALESK